MKTVPFHPSQTAALVARQRQPSAGETAGPDTAEFASLPPGDPSLLSGTPAPVAATRSRRQSESMSRQQCAETCVAPQHRRLFQALRQSPLPPETKHVLLRVLKHALEHPERTLTHRQAPEEIVSPFGLVDWAYQIKTERAVLQQSIQQAEDIGLLSLEPIPFYKCEYFLRWTTERTVRQPRPRHTSTRDEARREQTEQRGAEPTPQHWKGRPPRRLWRQLRQAVLARDEHTCHYCGTRSGRMACDHVIPVSKGGSSTLDNLVTACLACNSAKATRTAEEWEQTRKRQPGKEVR